MNFKLPKHITELLLRTVRARDHILDIGIGSFHVGEFVVRNILGDHGVYIGLDKKREVLERAELIVKDMRKETLFYVSDVTSLKSTHIKNSGIDCILLFHILHEYIDDHVSLSRLLHECDRVLKIGGKIIIYDFVIEKNNIHNIQTDYKNYKEVMKSEQYILTHDEITDHHELLIVEKK